jgi:hypothetical protein
MNTQPAPPLRIAIVGAGWAGQGCRRARGAGGPRGDRVRGRAAAGRARRALTLPDGRRLMVDNGQHILIGAYESLRLMRTVGVDPSALLRLPLTLRFADGMGLRFARAAGRWPASCAPAAGAGPKRHNPAAQRPSAQRALALPRERHVTVATLCRALPPAPDGRVHRAAVRGGAQRRRARPAARARAARRACWAGAATPLLLPRIDLGALPPEPPRAGCGSAAPCCAVASASTRCTRARPAPAWADRRSTG